tara:strand:- start:383 stop:1777 length:1395 start_codon:yes stop_codon:yes gene_type:complete
MISNKKEIIDLSNVSIRIVCHACVLITIGKIRILCDPWLMGDVFNNSWSLQLKSQRLDLLTKEDINSLTHIWISHEHPDHCHFPSLKFLSNQFEDISKITVLVKKDIRFMENIFPELRKLGFKKIKNLNHLEEYKIVDNLSISIFHRRNVDSALLIFLNKKPIILNINDAVLSNNDCNLIKKRFGNFKILINQFSIAGFNGILDERELKKLKDERLKIMINQHKCLQANVTIPFASFMWFSRQDNRHLNKWHNSALDVYDFFKREKLNCYCIEPPSEPILIEKIINKSNKPQHYLKNIEPEYHDENIHIGKKDLAQLIEKRISELKTYSNSILFSFVEKEFFIFVKDKNWILKLISSKSKITCECLDTPLSKNYPKLVANLQPLHYAFSNSFGIQTLGISGRYFFEGYNKVPKIWKLIRILSSLDNSKTPLRFSTFFKKSLYEILFNRLDTLPNQIIQQLKRFF